MYQKAMIEYKLGHLNKEPEIYFTKHRLHNIYLPVEKDFPVDTHRQVMKRYFWKTFKIDIDKLPNYLSFRVLDENTTMLLRLEGEKKIIEYDIQVYKKRLEALNGQTT